MIFETWKCYTAGTDPRQRPPHGHTAGVRGFALVITLTLMALLIILALGLLSLSAVSLRVSFQTSAQAEAQANARLALMLAIGDLQKELGPDRRISSNASILDQTPDSVETDGVSQPHYLGVWESWNTWLTDEQNKLSIQATYKTGRDPALFRRWLISDPAGGRDLGMVLEQNVGTASEMCQVVWAEDAKSQVSVPKIPIYHESTKTGAYAWWIADESQKARINLHERQAAGEPRAAQVVASHGGRPGVEKMTDMAGFNTAAEILDRMVTTGQATLTAKDAGKRFHDLTAYSAGLLTDVRAGGFKGDLNHAFEVDDENSRPREMRQQVSLFGTPFDAPIRPMSGLLNGIQPQNPYIAPVSWRQMIEYYRLYRETGIYKALEWNGDSPFTRRFLMGKKSNPHIFDQPDTKGYARQLVLLRQTWIIATRVEKGATVDTDKYFLCAVPFVVYWNPYNVPMKVASNEICTVATLSLAASIQYKVYGNEQDSTPAVSGLVSTSKSYAGYQTTPRETGNGDIDFKPGEIRAFSVVDAMADRRVFAEPGYQPLENTAATRGLQEQIAVPTGSTTPSLSLQLVADARRNDNHWWGNSERAVTIGTYQTNEKPRVFNEAGATLTGDHANTFVMGAYSVDWLTSSEIGGAWLVGNTAASRARWNPNVNYPVPIAILSIMAKSPERMPYGDNGASYARDFGNRTWLHAPPTALSHYLMNPSALSRSDSPYLVHFRPVNGDQEVSQFLQVNGRNAYYGGGYGPATGQTQLVALDLPSAPITNLAGFAGMRIDHARPQKIQPNAIGSPYPMFNLKHLSHVGAAFGPGIGNAYAHPMIAPDKVYTRVDLGADAGHPYKDSSFMSTGLNAFDDQWDHLFLANEGLWDSWFCSGLVPEVTDGVITKTRESVAESFFNGTHGLVSERLAPYPGGKNPAELAAITDADSGWQSIAAHLVNAGQFNVNSTSKEAWKAILMGLRDRPVAWQDAQTGKNDIRRDKDKVVLSRFNLANSAAEGTGPKDKNSWLGVRSLSEAQIDELATQIVRQVKLRGPFLNMTEFVNRRLTADRTGVTGALQAAIDADEFDAGYTGASPAGGINAAYKAGVDMIKTPPAVYPNPKAALGSRYAGIPGYVMQSDVMQGIASSISVRGDTFLIRSYGESSAGGKIVARAWCEAVVQRVPEYVDPADAHDKWLRDPDGSPATMLEPGAELPLSPVNRLFGRRFNIVSFRWLTPETI